MKIRIERLSDDYECEDCGWSCAYGANVWFDDKLQLELKPVAHCFGGNEYTDEDIYKRILEELGHTVITEG